MKKRKEQCIESIEKPLNYGTNYDTINSTRPHKTGRSDREVLVTPSRRM